jgi:O-methyltransferase
MRASCRSGRDFSSLLVLTRGRKKLRLRRLIQWPLQRVMMRLSRRNLFLVRGPNDTLDSRRFLGSRYFSIATDFARNGVAELVAQEIHRNEVPGDVAELGVFEGDFAALLHSHLPERPIHLFDTFSGFAHRDVQTEMGASIPSLPDFSGTSIGEVLRKFPKGAPVMIYPGWFPDTANGVRDKRFALVSLDADLYQPILSGLRFFWPRLSPGGFILVHDYNNTGMFPGCRRAVAEFQREHPITLMPVPDVGGTAVIAKPLTERTVATGDVVPLSARSRPGAAA